MKQSEEGKQGGFPHPLANSFLSSNREGLPCQGGCRLAGCPQTQMVLGNTWVGKGQCGGLGVWTFTADPLRRHQQLAVALPLWDPQGPPGLE